MTHHGSAAESDAAARLAALKNEAKRLKKAWRAGDAGALARLDANWSGPRPALTHASALLVIARERGEPSWTALRLSMETAGMSRSERVAALEGALRRGARRLERRLLSLDPGLATAHLGIIAALGDEAGATAALSADPQAALRPVGGGTQSAPPAAPLLHLCFSQRAGEDAERAAAMTRIGARLLALGADPTDGLSAAPGSDHRRSALYGALCRAELPRLAALLLEAGADPNDNESLYHATELEDPLPALRLLYAHGARHPCTNALPRMLDREHAPGVRLMLANGADPNEPLRRGDPAAEAAYGNALTHAIRRGRSGEIVEILLTAGADPNTRLGGCGPYAVARIYGSSAAAAALERRGLAPALTPVEACLAAVAEGETATAARLAAAEPTLFDGLSPIIRSLAVEWAGDPRRLPALMLLHRLGLPVEEQGDAGLTPLQMAAWHGLTATVSAYLALGADPNRLNVFGGDAVATALHGSLECPGREDGDYPETLRLLAAHGARIDPALGHLSMGSDAAAAAVEDLWDDGGG